MLLLQTVLNFMSDYLKCIAPNTFKQVVVVAVTVLYSVSPAQ